MYPCDADLRVSEHIKCLAKKADEYGINSRERQDILSEALALTENVNMNALDREHIARIFSLKGVVLSKIGKSVFYCHNRLHFFSSFFNLLFRSFNRFQTFALSKI